MVTSKKYYEDKIRDFNRFRLGRTLAQFYRDEGIDYEWMHKTKRKYSGKPFTLRKVLKWPWKI